MIDRSSASTLYSRLLSWLLTATLCSHDLNNMARFVLTVILVLTVFVALSQPGDNGTPGNETAGTYESSKNVTSGCVVVFYNFRESENFGW